MFETQGGTRNRTQDLPKKGSAFITSSDHWMHCSAPRCGCAAVHHGEKPAGLVSNAGWMQTMVPMQVTHAAHAFVLQGVVSMATGRRTLVSRQLLINAVNTGDELRLLLENRGNDRWSVGAIGGVLDASSLRSCSWGCEDCSAQATQDSLTLTEIHDRILDEVVPLE